MIDQIKQDSRYQINIDRRNQKTKQKKSIRIRSKETVSKEGNTNKRRRDHCDHVNDRHRPKEKLSLPEDKNQKASLKKKTIVGEEEEDNGAERERSKKR